MHTPIIDAFLELERVLRAANCTQNEIKGHAAIVELPGVQWLKLRTAVQKELDSVHTFLKPVPEGSSQFRISGIIIRRREELP